MSQAPFVINPALVAIAVDYAAVNRSARGYVADLVVPRVRVDAPLFRYAEYKIEDAFTVYDNQIDRLGRFNEIVQTATETTGATLDYGLLEKVPYRDELAARNQSIPWSNKVRAVQNVIDKNQLAREIRVSNLMFSAGSYQAAYRQTLSGTSQWSDFTNSDPVAMVRDTARGMLIAPNTAVMSKKVRDILGRHPKVAVALGGSLNSGRYVSDAELAAALGVERIIVGNTLRQTSKRGQAVTTGYIWGDNFALIYLPPTGPDGMALGVESPAFALTFQWGDVVSGENTYRPGEMGLFGGVGVYTGESLVEKQVAPFAGYLFSSVVA